VTSSSPLETPIPLGPKLEVLQPTVPIHHREKNTSPILAPVLLQCRKTWFSGISPQDAAVLYLLLHYQKPTSVSPLQ